MKRKAIYSFLMLCLCSTSVVGQASTIYFNTIGENSHCTTTRVLDNDSSILSETMDSLITDAGSQLLSSNDYSMLSTQQLEDMIAKYEGLIKKRKFQVVKNDATNVRILSYYEGEPRDLTMKNLVDVVQEVGLSNQLFVLAQAVLETGHFSSRVCKEYHNLFGLYDSRHHDYYRFEKWEDSVIGYKKFIQYRYKGGNYLSFLDRIGYAEGKGYTRKVAQIARQLYRQLFSN